MTDVNKISFIQETNPALPNSTSVIPSSDGKTETKGGVPDLFNKDVMHAPQKQPVKEEQVSLWSRVMQWFFGPQTVQTTSATTTELTTVDKVVPNRTPSLDSVPVIEEPTSVETTHTQKVLQGKTPFTFRAQDDNLRNLTMEQLFIALVKASIKMQEEKGLIATANFEQSQAMAKVNREKLQKALDEMKSNERWSSFFSYGQSIAGWTSVVTTIGMMAAKAGLIASSAAFGPAALAALAVTTGITTGGKALFDKKKNDHAADKEKRDLDLEVISDASNDQTQRMKDSLDAIANLQGLLMQMERRKHGMKQLILR